jgi:hypothetical protein
MLGKFRYTFFFILMFSYLNCIIYDFFSLSYNPDLGTEFTPNSDQPWDNIGSTQHHMKT